jgi:hypothetical protein
MDLDFKEFSHSDFYKLSKFRYSYDKKCFVETDIGMYDTNINRCPGFNDTIEEWMASGLSSRVKDIPHLNRAVRSDDTFIPPKFKFLILSQWIEVSRHTSQIPAPVRSSNLIIQPPGSKIPTHTHLNTPKILTFCYRYNNDRLFNASDSILTMSNRNAVYPEYDKFWFTIDKDKAHGSYSNEWRFFYFHDYDEDIEKYISGWNMPRWIY